MRNCSDGTPPDAEYTFKWARCGMTRHFTGKFVEARACRENALSLWDPTFRRFSASPDDPYVQLLIFLSRTLLYLGRSTRHGCGVTKRWPKRDDFRPTTWFLRCATLGTATGRAMRQNPQRPCFTRRRKFWLSPLNRGFQYGPRLGVSCAAGVWAQ